MSDLFLSLQLIEAYHNQDITLFEKLLQAGANPNAPSYIDKWEESLLTLSVFDGKTEYAILLIEHGAPLYDKLYRSSIVHNAVFVKNHELLRYLYRKYDKSELEIYENSYGPPIFVAIFRKDHMFTD